MQGNLYIITNNINCKIYIGKTYNDIDHRFKEHINNAYKIDYDTLDYRYNTKFYNAIRKYGPENFKIKLINKFEEGILEQKEMEYIAKYDSYHNGYNSTLGGDGVKSLDISEDMIESICSMYKDGKTIKDIAIIFEVGQRTITKILNRSGVEIRHNTDLTTKHGIIMYDRLFTPVYKFNDIREIEYYLMNNTAYSINIRTLYAYVNKSSETGCIRYGRRWQKVSDLIYEDKVFRTKFDKEAYIQGGHAYQSEDKQYYIVNGALNNVLNSNKNVKTKTKIIKCKICGIQIEQGKYCNKCQLQRDLNKVIKRKEYETNYKRVRIIERTERCKICNKPITAQAVTGMCNSCANVVAKGKSPKPSKEELKVLLDQGLQKKQIAELYGRTDSTVHYWINSYKLK